MKSISVRGKTFVGTVVSDKMNNTVVVEWIRRVPVKKFERYEKRKSRVSAHNPDNIDAKEGDIVRIKETRPISKTKNFIVSEIVTKAN
ncbi:MAG: 30S ribosomal protein S17 [Nanobdellota archaeon]